MNILTNLEYFNDIGIGWLHGGYIEVSPSQDVNLEFIKVLRFINNYIYNYVVTHSLNKDDMKLDFINYGKTELVFVLTIKDEKVALLVKQPNVEYGLVRQEMENLRKLSEKDNNVIKPIEYYSDGEYELYTTPYINKTRCVAAQTSWGMYVPDSYRFVEFNEVQESMVNSCMIAKLLSYYDFDNNVGISKCQLAGGDFMLIENYEHRPPSIDNTLKSMYLIAARDIINVSYEDYIKLIRKEFSINTMLEDDNSIFINKRCRVPMKEKDIENGIILAKSLNKDKWYNRF